MLLPSRLFACHLSSPVFKISHGGATAKRIDNRRSGNRIQLSDHGAIAYVIADGKGKDPVSWVIFSLFIAIFALPVLMIRKNTRVDRKPYVAKGLAIFALGVAIQVAIRFYEVMSAGY